MASWFVYLLRCRDHSLYCGVTPHLERRMREHNAGRGARYIVPSRRPVMCAWKRRTDGVSTALRLEAWIKRLPAAVKRDLAEGRATLRRGRDGTWKIASKT